MPTETLRYPPAPPGEVVDTYHGVRVPDPYRWLEDAEDPATIGWVAAQNALTRAVLDGEARAALARQLTTLYEFPRTGVPVKRGGRCFYTHNPGLEKQPVLYVEDGPGASPRVLLDPNGLSTDGTTALTAFEPSGDGALVACALSTSGSDLQEIVVIDVPSAARRHDRLRWVKFASLAWVPEGSGFYYTRFPQPGTVAAGDENYFNRVCFHRLGDAQAEDALILERPGEREVVFAVDVSNDGRWVVMTAFQGASEKSAVYLLDRGSPVPTGNPRRASGAAPFILFPGFDHAYSFVQEADGRLYFVTDERAPRGRIIAVDPDADGQSVTEIVPESADRLSLAVLAGGRLVCSYLRNASDQVRLFGLGGAAAGEIPLPALGSITGLTGRLEDDELFLGFHSFTHPPASYACRVEAAALRPFRPGSSPVDPSQYETTQVWYPSGDGTRISMFLVHRRGLQQGGSRPVLLSGYGGFNVNLTPAFDPSTFAWLDRGGLYAVANLRGGGEYGEAWHQAGMRDRKQNVFDDFIAAAEWLVANGWTTPANLAIEGGSNGGLLTGAVMVQRPDLFGAVVCRVPVADMLRYHLFTVGRFWVPEYGSSDDPAQFEYLLRYSPLHNVEDGARYPPILITTADTDDRVAPGMAKKFAARLQAAGGGGPVLIRVETRAGHGAGKPVTKIIEEDADIFAFLLKYLSVDGSA
jgi:prolyl oligopeptidase